MESVVSVQRTVKMSNKDVQQILFSLVVLSLQFTSVFKGVLPAAGLPSLSSSLKRWRSWKTPNIWDELQMCTICCWKHYQRGWKVENYGKSGDILVICVSGIIFRCPQYAVGGIVIWWIWSQDENSILMTLNVLQQVPNLSPLSGLQVGRPPFWEAFKVLSGWPYNNQNIIIMAIW